MLYLLPIIAIPAIVMLGFKLTHSKEFTVGEFLGLEALMILVLTGMFLIGKAQSVNDYEVWNGRIAAKTHGSQHCCHCRQVCDTCTRTDSKGHLETYSCNCRQVCDHFLDYWWDLNVTTGDKISIKNCEPSKRRVPAAWTKARVGEPASVEHKYKNYLLADPDSLFTHKEGIKKFSAPNYPKIKSYYKINRVLSDGISVGVRDYNQLLSELNADLGAKKQVNIIILFTNKSPEYADFLEEEWLYGKKNDLIFVLGTKDAKKVEWARVVTISNVEELKLKARDQMIGMSISEPEGIIEHISHLVENDFKRTPMAEYEYLYASATPGPIFTFFMYLIGLIISIVGSYLLINNNIRERNYEKLW